MDELEKLRKEIAEIDQSLIMLLARRNELARLIGKYKRKHGLPVEDVDVEAKNRQKRDEEIAILKGEKEDLEKVFETIIQVARDLQSRDID